MPISYPSVSISLTPASQSISTGPQRVLFIGQKVTAGTATSSALTENIGNANEWDTLFGANSMLAGFIRAFRKINKVTRIDAIALDDAGGGVAATGTVVFSGTATAAGTLYVTVGSYLNNRYALPIAIGDTAAAKATALAALVNADTYSPVTATPSTGTVTLAFDHKGLEGNSTNLRVEGAVAGLTFTVTGFASGATNPTIPGLSSLIGDVRYQTIVWPTSYVTTELLSNLLDLRFNVNNSILDGVGVQTLVDTEANLVTTSAALNNKNYLIIGARTVSDTYWKGNGYQELPGVVSSIFAALRSLRLTSGANIGSYITSTIGLLDSFGGPAIAGLPYFNTPVNDIQLVPVGKDWTLNEVSALVTSGVTVLGNNTANNGVILGDPVTTYKNDAAGNADVTFKYLNHLDVSSTVREYFFNNLKAQYSQSRLTNGALVPYRSVANGPAINSFLDKLYADLAGPDYILLQGGEDAKNFFKNNRNTILDLINGKATITMQAPLISQLRNLLAAMQIAFSIG